MTQQRRAVAAVSHCTVLPRWLRSSTMQEVAYARTNHACSRRRDSFKGGNQVPIQAGWRALEALARTEIECGGRGFELGLNASISSVKSLRRHADASRGPF